MRPCSRCETPSFNPSFHTRVPIGVSQSGPSADDEFESVATDSLEAQPALLLRVDRCVLVDFGLVASSRVSLSSRHSHFARIETLLAVTNDDSRILPNRE